MIVLDLETTGLEIDGDQIVSIGAVDFLNPSRTFYEECRVSPDITLSDEVLTIIGLPLPALMDQGKPTVKDVTGRFIRWASSCQERTLAGENPWFDVMFLRRATRESHLDWTFGHRYVDLHSISYASLLRANRLPQKANGDSDLGLDRTLEYVGLERRSGPHNALNDAKLEAEALSRLIFAKSLLGEYAHHPIPSHLNPRTLAVV